MVRFATPGLIDKGCSNPESDGDFLPLKRRFDEGRKTGRAARNLTRAEMP